MNRHGMVRILVVTAALGMFGGSAMAAKANGGGGGKPSPGVTSTVLDWSVETATVYRIRSDSSVTGSQMYFDGVDSIVSQCPGDYYELSALSSSRRRMFLDLGDPLQSAVPAGVFGGGSSGFVAGRFVSKLSSGLCAIKGVGSTMTTGLPFVFTGADGLSYQLRMNSVNEPGTTDSIFTCTQVAGSNQNDPAAACVVWTARPASGDGVAVGRLVQNYTHKGKTYSTYLGDFRVTFSLSFSKP